MKRRLLATSSCKRLWHRVNRYLYECKMSLSPLPDPTPDSNDPDVRMKLRIEEAIRKERHDRSMDPRYNLYAQPVPKQEELEKMTAFEKHMLILKLTRKEFSSGWIGMFYPPEEYKAPTSEADVTEDVQHKETHGVTAEAMKEKEQREQKKIEQKVQWAEIARDGFLAFLKGYEEGKTAEESKGPLKININPLRKDP